MQIRAERNVRLKKSEQDLQKTKRKNSTFWKIPNRGGKGGPAEVGMVSHILPVFNFESFPKGRLPNEKTHLYLELVQTTLKTEKQFIEIPVPSTLPS